MEQGCTEGLQTNNIHHIFVSSLLNETLQTSDMKFISCATVGVGG